MNATEAKLITVKINQDGRAYAEMLTKLRLKGHERRVDSDSRRALKKEPASRKDRLGPGEAEH